MKFVNYMKAMSKMCNIIRRHKRKASCT